MNINDLPLSTTLINGDILIPIMEEKNIVGDGSIRCAKKILIKNIISFITKEVSKNNEVFISEKNGCIVFSKKIKM